MERTRRKESKLLTLSEPKTLETKYYLTSNGLFIASLGRWEAWYEVTKRFPNKKITIRRRITL